MSLPADRLADPFARTAPPAHDLTSRQGRVMALLAAARALEAGELPDAQALAFLTSGLSSFLRGEGDLLKDCWRITPARGSNATAARIAARIAMQSTMPETGDSSGIESPPTQPP